MRAVVFDQHGTGVDLYRCADDLPIPAPAADEVLVRVHYGALNRLDDWVRIGWPGIGLALPHVPGSDFSGEIVECGAEAGDWQPGQRVTGNNALWCGECVNCHRGLHNRCHSFGILGESCPGAMSEFIAVPARNLVEIPAGYDMRRAAAASLTYLTAWHSLIKVGHLQPGERVLVVGAGGGVNVAAQQIAQRRGASVYVVASSASKAARAREEGAVWTCDRSVEPDWGRAVHQATDRAGVHMVVDNVGGATFATSLRSLTVGGRLVTVGGTAGYEAPIPVNLVFMRHLSLLGSTMGTQADYFEVMAQVFSGQLAPVIDSEFEPARYGEAIKRMCSGSSYGKIVVNMRAWDDGAA